MEEKKFKNGMEYHQQKLYNYYCSPVNLEKDNRISGVYGWLTLLSLVAAYDVYAIKSKNVETLTRAFWRMTESKAKSILPVAVWTGLTVHLLAEKKIRKKIFETKNTQ